MSLMKIHLTRRAVDYEIDHDSDDSRLSRRYSIFLSYCGRFYRRRVYWHWLNVEWRQKMGDTVSRGREWFEEKWISGGGGGAEVSRDEKDDTKREEVREESDESSKRRTELPEDTGIWNVRSKESDNFHTDLEIEILSSFADIKPALWEYFRTIEQLFQSSFET